MPNPTIVSAALNDKELRESITKLVNDYKNSLEDMKSATTDAVRNIQETIKSIGSTKVDFSGTLDGLEKAKKKMAAAASGGGSGSLTKDSVVAPKTIGDLEESIRLEEKKRKEMKLGSDELALQNDLIDKQKKKLKEETETITTRLQKNYNKLIGNAVSLPSRTLSDAETKLIELEKIMSQMRGKGFISVQQINRVQNAIDSVKNKIERLRSKKPMTMQEVLGMDENSIEAIARKMQALKRVTIDPQNAQQVKQLGEEYTRLGKKQNEYLGKNLLIQKSNHMLASTFGYIRNRIIYAFTLGALASFFRDLRNIRAEYEMLDRSLGILVGDFEKGTRIFNELNEMALKSPFTLIELGTAAKQLTAYNFAADEVVDTTRRIADISAALGVPIERLVYNLGQIKAQGSLTARDARDFANAGLAIVPMLAEMYTKQKAFGKELTTTADVYDMMSKKMVSYGDVLKVIQQVTDEGGKFFNFQARQADTLKVQIANLSLAYNNMMNDIGASNQGLLSGSIQMVRSLFQNWKTVVNVIEQLIVTFGTYKVVATATTLLTSRMFVGGILVNLRNYIRGIKAATGAMATFNAVTKMNPIAFLATALATVVGYFLIFKDNVEEASQEVELFGENASKTLKKIDTFKKILDGTSETSSTYKKTLSELSGVMHEYGVELDAEKARRDEVNKATEQTIQLIKEESAERQRANQLEKARETFDTENEAARKNLVETIQKSSNIAGGGVSAEYIKAVRENAEAISAIIEEVVDSNLKYILNKEGEELDAGLERIYTIVNERLTKIGIKGGEIQQILGGFLTTTTAVEKFAKATADANEKLERRTQIINRNHEIAQESIQSTMSFTQKVEANSRALQNNTNDALSLYNRIYDIVKIAQQNHTINFDLKLTADNPPAWMLDKSLPELQRLAQRFAAIAESGGHAEGYNREGTYEQALRYASAARKKQEDEERAARTKNNTKTKKERDAILDAIKEEISLTKKLQGEYDKLTAKGASHADAIKDVQDRYANTIKLLDIDLGKFGLPKFDTNIITGKDPNKQLEYFKNLRDVLESKGLLNLDRAKVVDVVIQELDVSAKTYNLDKITKGLNNELDRLKEEYELAVSLDADPELGNMFADWMGIDVNDLPRTASEYAERASKILNNKLKDLGAKTELPNLLSIKDDDMRAFEENKTFTDAQLELVKKAVEAARGFQRKETEERIKDWDKLLEKYAEYETKVNKIHNDAVKERVSFAQQFGSEEDKSLALKLQTQILAATDPQEKQKLIKQLQELVLGIAGDDKTKINLVTAINNSEQQGVAKANFEEYQKSPEWIAATGDLAGMTTNAIGYLISSLEKYKKSAKNLDPKQIKQINSALRNLHRQQRQGNPFLQIADAIDSAKARAEEFQPEMDALMSDIIALEKEIGDNDPTEEQAKHLKSLKDRWKDLAEQGEVSATEYVDAINASISAASQAISMFTDMVDALSGNKWNEAREILGDVTSTIEKAGQGAAIGAQTGGLWGAIIGGVAGGIMGAITAFADNGNKKIDAKIKESEVAVKRLEAAYVDLQNAMDKAYGTGIVGSKRLLASMKELELAELERQLALEQSRSSKNRDEGTIADLQKQIKELRYEIEDTITEITNELLGGEAGSFAENLVSSMIDAFKNGEDYMKVFEDKFDEMIDNMIMKSITSKVVAQYIDRIWDDMDARIKVRSTLQADELARATKRRQELESMDIYAYGEEKGIGKYGIDTVEDARRALEEMYNTELAVAKEAENAAQKAYDAASTMDDSDISTLIAELAEIKPELGERLREILGEYYKFGETSNQELSALQQGIQGITETTAGALEAYMNGVSQQVYYQSDLMTQIRDAVVGFNMDVQVASMSQILLQLRSSYEMQTAIHSMLDGWSSPNGMSVRVEMV